MFVAAKSHVFSNNVLSLNVLYVLCLENIYKLLYSTIEKLALRILLERRIDINRSTYIALLDIEMAFDDVD